MIGALSQGWERGCGVARCWLLRGFAALVVMSALAAMPAAAAEYALPPGQKVVVGELGRYVVQRGDVFPDIARHFDVGYTALVAANPGVDPWLPRAGREIKIPSLYVLPDAPHQGIVLNLAQWQLFYFPPGGDRVESYPIGLGIIGRKTPLGATRVVRKEPNPAWYPPPSIRAERPELPAVIPPGPDNPLGAFALHLGWPSYLIHGTNKPDGVGRNVSHGCVRLYPDDIEKLFNAVAVGTPVRTVDQPAVAGWSGDTLYVQVYPSKSQVEEIDIERRVSPDPAQGVEDVVRAAAGRYAGSVDWAAVEQAARARTGMPVRLADRSGVAREQSRPDYDRSAAQPYDRAPAQPYDRQAALPYELEAAQPAYDPEAVQSYPPYYGGRAAQPYQPDYDREAVQPYYYRRKAVQPF
jgi:L,D-transpeptidase ErfK/SrfK